MTQTETKWSERVRQWRASGRTAEQFAQGRGFEPSTLRYWASRLKMDATMATSEAPPERSSSSSVRMVCVRRGVGGRQPEAITITVGGARIELKAGFDRALLGEVVEALGGAR